MCTTLSVSADVPHPHEAYHSGNGVVVQDAV
jgi:hypothetical protein